jgi:hypothetical protein
MDECQHIKKGINRENNKRKLISYTKINLTYTL